MKILALARALGLSDRCSIAVRASFSMGASAALGWATAGFPAGMLATLGAFTSLYVPNRPYANRAIVLAGVALAITVMVVCGMALRPFTWGTAAVVILASAVIIFIANAARIGPPGAYLIVLAGAAGTSLPSKLTSAEVTLLVAAGGAVSWIVHMAGALHEPRRPEKRAVLAAAAAVERAAAANGDESTWKYRRAAAEALHEAWAALTTFQPFDLSRTDTLDNLRAINRRLHAIFAEQIRSGDAPASRRTIDRIRDLAGAVRPASPPTDHENATPLPLGRLELWQSLVESLDRRSPPMRTAILVAVAAGAAGAVSLLLHLERPYWSIAAAVLVLHQGLGWGSVVRKAIDRTIGTAAGLVLAGAFLSFRLSALVVVVSLVVLQFVTELLVVRKYALAVVFITANALLIASGGQAVSGAGPLVWDRGVDTLLGCVTAIAVYAAIGRRELEAPLTREAARVQESIGQVQRQLDSGDVVSLPARRARRDLQHRLLSLAAAHERYAGERLSDEGSEHLLADIETLEQHGYATLAACWAMERPAALPLRN
jgi:uncharacterized membrane protein YccC